MYLGYDHTSLLYTTTRLTYDEYIFVMKKYFAEGEQVTRFFLREQITKFFLWLKETNEEVMTKNGNNSVCCIKRWYYTWKNAHFVSILTNIIHVGEDSLTYILTCTKFKGLFSYVSSCTQCEAWKHFDQYFSLLL